MKLLHTSDWHVGKTLKGRNRLAEQREVLDEIVSIAVGNAVDAVLLAGDLYDTSAPSAGAQQLVVHTLLRLARAGIEVIAIAGNHDHGPTFEAYRPLMEAAGVQLAGRAWPADNGGVYRFTARSTGEEAVVAVLPFLSQRYAVRTAEIIANRPADNVGTYDEMVRQILANLTGAFGDNTVNVIMAHLTCTGGKFGGGERAAQSIFEYHVPAAIFPTEAHYVALGHLHRRQQLPASCPVHYSGAPFAVDFGEQDNTSVVCLVEVSPTIPAKVTDIPIRGGRRLRTVRGTVAQLTEAAATFGDDYLRVYVKEATRAGLREQILDVLRNALEIRIDPEFASATPVSRGPGAGHHTKSAGQLFAQFCASRNVDDPRILALFNALNDQVSDAEAADRPTAESL